MENTIRQGYKLEVSKNLTHHIEGRLTSERNEVKLDKEDLAAFNKLLVIKGNILNDRKLIVNYDSDENLFTARMMKKDKKKEEYTIALVQGLSLDNALLNLNDYLAWYGKDMESSIDTIKYNLDKGYTLLLLNGASSFLKADDEYQRLLINKLNEKKASIFSMFPNIMKALADNQTMMIAITKDKNKYNIKSRDFLTGQEDKKEEVTDLLEGLVNINNEQRKEKVLCKKHC